MATSTSAGCPVSAARSAATRPARSWVLFARVWSFPRSVATRVRLGPAALRAPAPSLHVRGSASNFALRALLAGSPGEASVPCAWLRRFPSSPRRGVSGALGVPFGPPQHQVARVAPAPRPVSPCRHGASPFGPVRPAAWFFVPVPATPRLAACAPAPGCPVVGSHEQPPLSVCRSLPDLSAVFRQTVTLGGGGLGSLGFQALRRVFYAPFRSTLRQLRGVAPAASRPEGQRCAATSSTSFVRWVGFSALARVVGRPLRAWDESFVHPLPVA